MSPDARCPLTPAEQHVLTAVGEDLANIKLRVLSPLEELLLLYPVPWQIATYERWKGAGEPDPIILDARGCVVDFIDDPDRRHAIAKAVNVAAAAIMPIAAIDAQCSGAEPREGVKNHH